MKHYQGKTRKEWATELGVAKGTFNYRVRKHGWEKAVAIRGRWKAGPKKTDTPSDVPKKSKGQENLIRVAWWGIPENRGTGKKPSKKGSRTVSECLEEEIIHIDYSCLRAGKIQKL